MIFLLWNLRQHSKHASFQGKGIKKLNPKQIVQRWKIALAQIKADSISENLSTEIFLRQMIYSLYQAKEITKKVYNNIINSINT